MMNNDKLIDVLFTIGGSLLVLVPTLYFLNRKEQRRKKMTQEERIAYDIRRQLWLEKNSFSAVLYKSFHFLLSMCIIIHIIMQRDRFKDYLFKRREYKNRAVILDVDYQNRVVSFDVYNGFRETIKIYTISTDTKSLILEQLLNDQWIRIQESVHNAKFLSLRPAATFTLSYTLSSQASPFRLGLSWESTSTTNSGIVWSPVLYPEAVTRNDRAKLEAEEIIMMEKHYYSGHR